jgi:hypothetical protein
MQRVGIRLDRAIDREGNILETERLSLPVFRWRASDVAPGG